MRQVKFKNELFTNRAFALRSADDSQGVGISYGDEALVNTGALPISSNLVCPVCRLLRINHDCIVEIENPKPKKSKVSLQELLWGKKEKKPRKEKPWDGVPSVFLAWKGNKKKIGKQRGFKNKKAIWWYSQADKNISKAEYITPGKFKKGGAGGNRTLENFFSIDALYSDIDSDGPLEWEEIIEECERKNIPKPNLIVRTSLFHYQLWWFIPEIYKSLLGLWEEVQKGIFNLFKEFGADGQALDAIRYLRNPAKCEKVYENKTGENSLSVMYRALKQSGFIQAKPKPKWKSKFSPNGIPIKESRAKLERFLRDNPEHESTYADLSQRLSIPERTVKYLCKQFSQEGRLETQVLSKGKKRKTKFVFKVHIKSIKNTWASKEAGACADFGTSSLGPSPGKEKKESVCVFSQALVWAKTLGFSKGVRNLGIFGLALWLSVSKKLTCEEVFKELYPVLIVTPGFSRREFEKTLKSACRDRYRYCISAKKFEKVFLSLGVLDSH